MHGRIFHNLLPDNRDEKDDHLHLLPIVVRKNAGLVEGLVIRPHNLTVHYWTPYGRFFYNKFRQGRQSLTEEQRIWLVNAFDSTEFDVEAFSGPPTPCKEWPSWEEMKADQPGLTRWKAHYVVLV